MLVNVAGRAPACIGAGRSTPATELAELAELAEDSTTGSSMSPSPGQVGRHRRQPGRRIHRTRGIERRRADLPQSSARPHVSRETFPPDSLRPSPVLDTKRSVGCTADPGSFIDTASNGRPESMRPNRAPFLPSHHSMKRGSNRRSVVYNQPATADSPNSIAAADASTKRIPFSQLDATEIPFALRRPLPLGPGGPRPVTRCPNRSGPFNRDAGARASEGLCRLGTRAVY